MKISLLAFCTSGLTVLFSGGVAAQADVSEFDLIVSTAHRVFQKQSAPSTAPPDLPVSPTALTALDGVIQDSAHAVSKRAKALEWPSRKFLRFARRIRGKKLQFGGFKKIFGGTGTALGDRDASIEGTAYLTFTTIHDERYEDAAETCIKWCAGIEKCVFVNLYYELENPSLPPPFLKCAAYGDVHHESEKTNFGGQDLGSPSGLTYMQQSSGFARISSLSPDTPPGYEAVFGPVNGSVQAPGYMGFALLTHYDVDACAQLCNTRHADTMRGVCQFFSIWRALVNGVPTTYTCAMYSIPATESTATNGGQGDLMVTLSRGYRRVSFIPDGTFESPETEGWSVLSPRTIIEPNRLAHGGHGLLSFPLHNSAIRTTTGSSTTSGRSYVLQFWYARSASSSGSSAASSSTSSYIDSSSGPSSSASSSASQSTSDGSKTTTEMNFPWRTRADDGQGSIEIVWNGDVIGNVEGGSSGWVRYEETVVAKGNDDLRLHRVSSPDIYNEYIDDISLFLL